jgi:hypothetical protein
MIVNNWARCRCPFREARVSLFGRRLRDEASGTLCVIYDGECLLRPMTSTYRSPGEVSTGERRSTTSAKERADGSHSGED